MDLEVAGIKVNPAVIAPLDSGFLPAEIRVPAPFSEVAVSVEHTQFRSIHV